MKIQVSQDILYQYIIDHNIKMARIAELMGKSDDVVTSCFKHHKNIHGNHRKFSRDNIFLINKALPIIANELQTRLLSFGSDQMYTNKRGATYDPAVIAQMKELGKYLNITGLTIRVLGWSKGKKSAVISQPHSKAYGAISMDDTILINKEILSIVGELLSYEVIYE